MLGDHGIVVKIVLWITFGIFAVIGILLLSGKGTDLIAGYNTSSEEEKKKYDKKKLSLVVGSGLSVISLFLLVMAIWASVLPTFVFYIFQGVVAVDCIVSVILTNTVCKKK